MWFLILWWLSVIFSISYQFKDKIYHWCRDNAAERFKLYKEQINVPPIDEHRVMIQTVQEQVHTLKAEKRIVRHPDRVYGSEQEKRYYIEYLARDFGVALLEGGHISFRSRIVRDMGNMMPMEVLEARIDVVDRGKYESEYPDNIADMFRLDPYDSDTTQHTQEIVKQLVQKRNEEKFKHHNQKQKNGSSKSDSESSEFGKWRD